MKRRWFIALPGGADIRALELRNIKAKPLRMIWLGMSFFILSSIGLAEVTHSQDMDAEFGKREFLRACASCHGAGGKGDGPIAKTLKQPPADLTKLSQNNNGVYPISRVYAVIDGRIQILVHGPRQMPVWGDVYTQGLKDRMPRDFMSKELLDALVRVRILMLIEYISTLQRK